VYSDGLNYVQSEGIITAWLGSINVGSGGTINGKSGWIISAQSGRVGQFT